MNFSADFLNYKPIFTDNELHFLKDLSKEYTFDQFISDHRSFEERSIDYAFVSSKIEGNQYSKKGASLLLKYGFTENGKTMQDAMMLVNLRDTFINVTLSTDDDINTVLTKRYLCSIHSEVSDKLLETRDRGQVRQKRVTIAGSDYIPLDSSFLLEAELIRLLTTASAIKEPFEQAVYIHCNIAYLQYFSDCNKRVARLMQTAVMAANSITPIFLQESAIQSYLISILNYYETGDYTMYKKLFLSEYEHTIKQLLGKAPEQIEAQRRALEEIKKINKLVQ